ncbi:hypothetical protein ABZ214_39205 [Streptomyces iakyrus]|uniref:hypothetical protein n=1 Tax=Streptomyces iakyrus TaxID=68219 RepID=UPI0033AF4739
MSTLLGSDRSARGTAARAGGHAVVGTGLAVGLYHATTDSAVSWTAVVSAVVVLVVVAYPVLRTAAPRTRAVALAALQALLPAWFAVTGGDVPAAELDGHLRLPATWHHNSLVMAAPNFLAALALTCLFRSASDVPTRLSHAVAATARRWWTRVLHLIGQGVGLAGRHLPQPRRPSQPVVTGPRPLYLTVLLYRVHPCAP